MKTLLLFIYILLLILPFQQGFLKQYLAEIQYIDEIFSLFAFLFIFFYTLIFLKIKRKFIVFNIFIIAFCLVGLISGILNNNEIKITFLGIFDYIKNFIFILLGIMYFNEKRLKSLFLVLLNLYVLICATAIIIVISNLLSFKLPDFLGYIIEIRFGIPRVAPFQIHPNMLGLCSLLFFILDFSLYPKFTFKKFLLLCGIILSGSRMVWTSFAVGMLFLVFIFKIRERIIYGFFLSLLFGIFVLPKIFEKTQTEYLSESYYRGYVIKKSFEIWKDSPFLGLGPGMYGGVVSVKFNSPIYERYNFSKQWYNFGLARFHSLDMFWPQILVECGLIGAILFLLFLYVLYKLARNKAINTNNKFVKHFSLGLSVVPIVIFFYLFGSGLNLAPFLITYSIFLGMCLGTKNGNFISK
ncbi:MAG: O-antigen ligase family protein [Candidatus Aenigmatarchaeota archaeon]